MADARSKAVYNKLVDKFSTNYPLQNIFTEMGNAYSKNEKVIVPTRSAIQILAASDSAGDSISLGVSTIKPTENEFTVDQHYGNAYEVAPLHAEFDLDGSWSDQLADSIKVEMDDFIDIDIYTKCVRAGAYTTTASLWVNVAAAAISADNVENARAKMLAQKGVRIQGLVWAFHPYGMGSVRRLSAFVPSGQNADKGDLGVPAVGTLHGIPVVESQSVPQSLSVATTAVSITSNVATATVAEGHGFVPGMLITTAGLTTNATSAVAITSVTGTTIVFPLTASDGAMADGVGTITSAMCLNALIYRPWTFRRIQKIPTIKIIPRSGRPGADELQFWSIWGRMGLPGCAVGLGSPASAVA